MAAVASGDTSEGREQIRGLAAQYALRLAAALQNSQNYPSDAKLKAELQMAKTTFDRYARML